MATKKSQPSRAKATTKKSAPKKAAASKSEPVLVEENIEVIETAPATAGACDCNASTIDDTPFEPGTIGEKFARLKPGALIAELLGTFVLAAVVIQLANAGTAGTIGIALTLAVLVIVFGVISGAHFNPAITIAQWLNRKVDGVKAVAYIVAQILGAALALAVMLGVYNANTGGYESSVRAAFLKQNNVTESEVQSQVGMSTDDYIKQSGGYDTWAKQLGVSKFIDVTVDNDKAWVNWAMELVGAIVFGLGVGYAVFKRGAKPIAKGLAVGMGLLGGLVIGGSTVILNPAVAGAIGGYTWVNPFGAEAAQFWMSIFTYFVATTVGMTIGVSAYRFLLKDVSTPAAKKA